MLWNLSIVTVPGVGKKIEASNRPLTWRESELKIGWRVRGGRGWIRQWVAGAPLRYAPAAPQTLKLSMHRPKKTEREVSP